MVASLTNDLCSTDDWAVHQTGRDTTAHNSDVLVRRAGAHAVYNGLAADKAWRAGVPATMDRSATKTKTTKFMLGLTGGVSERAANDYPRSAGQCSFHSYDTGTRRNCHAASPIYD